MIALESPDPYYGSLPSNIQQAIASLVSAREKVVDAALSDIPFEVPEKAEAELIEEGMRSIARERIARLLVDRASQLPDLNVSERKTIEKLGWRFMMQSTCGDSLDDLRNTIREPNGDFYRLAPFKKVVDSLAEKNWVLKINAATCCLSETALKRLEMHPDNIRLPDTQLCTSSVVPVDTTVFQRIVPSQLNENPESLGVIYDQDSAKIVGSCQTIGIIDARAEALMSQLRF